METARKDKRIYTKRTQDQRRDLILKRLEVLKAAHATRAKLIAKLEAKLTAQATPQ
jgi:hypothetical protein